MIEIFNSEAKVIGSFQSYNELLNHIEKIEKQKFIETGKEGWVFYIYSDEMLSKLYWGTIKALKFLLTKEQQDAYEGGFDLLEMTRCDNDNPVQIILTPEVDINEIKRDWCRDYCSNHGYVLLETKK